MVLKLFWYMDGMLNQLHMAQWQYLWYDCAILQYTLSCLILLKSQGKNGNLQSIYYQPGHVAQSVTCLATDASLIADPGIADPGSGPGLILLWRLIRKYFLRSFSSLPLNHSRRVVVSYKQKYVHELLVNCLFKLAQKRMWLGELTVPPWP